MQTKLLVPALAAGLALSASVFGQNANADLGWTRSTAADSMTGANTYSPNTYRAEKAHAREQKKFQHQQQLVKNTAGSQAVVEGGSYSLGLSGVAVTSSQAGSAKMNQPVRTRGISSSAQSAKMNPGDSLQTKSAAANWKAEEGD